MTLLDLIATAEEAPWEQVIPEVLQAEGREVTEAAVNQRRAGIPRCTSRAERETTVKEPAGFWSWRALPSSTAA